MKRKIISVSIGDAPTIINTIDNAERATGLNRTQLMTLCLVASYSRLALKRVALSFVALPKEQQQPRQDLPQYT
jgi:hypothetical protein